MNRRKARELAFALIYELGVQTDKTADEIITDTAREQEFSPDDYIKSVVSGVEKEKDAIDALISEKAVGWKLERISGVSLAIMRLASYEMMNVEDVPFNVAINEAVELAKKYDHEKAPRFINGILNSIAEEKRLKKPKA